MQIQWITRLRQVRESRRLSVAQLATLAGVSRQTIYSLESGRVMPRGSIMFRLAAALDVRPSELFDAAPREVGEGAAS